MIFTLAGYELRRMFFSPLAWAILAVVIGIAGYMFLKNLDYYLLMQGRFMGAESGVGVTEAVVAPLLGNTSVVLLLVTPIISMRLMSDERRNKTLSLLLSAPLSMTEIVLGKYLGLVLFLWLIVAVIALFALSLLLGGSLDYGMFAAGLLGLSLLLAGYAAVGVFMSTLTQYQIVAAVGTFGILLLFWILDWAGEGLGGTSLLSYMSLLNHYEPFLRGVISTQDLVYHAVFITTFLVFSIRRLDMDRLGG